MTSPLRTSFRLVRRALAPALVALGLVGCSRSAAKNDEPSKVAVIVPVLSATWVRNFNPYLLTQARWPTGAGIHEPLAIYNAIKGEYVPWLAESFAWTVPGLEVTFLLRPGVKWSDGAPFSAEDVVFTWELMKRHRALDQTSTWERLESVLAEGNLVRFRFKEPAVPSFYFVAEQPIVPAHVWKDVKDPVTFRNENPVGTGPYTEVRSFKTQVYELGKNPHYWQEGRPYLDAVRLPALPGNEQAALALIRGEVDWGALFLPAIDRIFVGKDPEHHGYHFPSVEGTVMLYPNHTHRFLRDVRVRKAISHAIDRARIVRIAMQGYTRPADATGLSDLYKRYWDPSVFEEVEDHTAFDPKRAAALLDEAGFRLDADGKRRSPSGELLEFDLNTVVGWSDWIIAAQIMTRDLEAVGLSINLRTYDHGAWFRSLQNGEFDLSMSWSSGGPTVDTFYERQMATKNLVPIGKPAPYCWQRYASKEADALFTEFAAATEFPEQQRLAKKLEVLFAKDAVTIPLFPGPTWGQFNTSRITGFPTKENPYAALAPYKSPGFLLALIELGPRGTGPTEPPTGMPRPRLTNARAGLRATIPGSVAGGTGGASHTDAAHANTTEGARP